MFWKISGGLYQKPFIRLADGQSLIQRAYFRGVQIPGVSHIMTVTNRELFFKIKDEFHAINASPSSVSFIIEPFWRNTAPAIAAAALQIASTHGPDAIMLILTADHSIADQAAFVQAVASATELALEGKIVTFGIQPDAPETGYDYIEANGNKVLRFVEKPSLEKAKEYLASGRFFWNSGMFCFKAGDMLGQMEKHCPDILSATRSCIEQSRLATGDGFSQLELEVAAFKKVPDASIDYAVMEKSEQVAVVPCNIGWSDSGFWALLDDLNTPDANGNRVQGDAMLHNTRDCTISSNDGLVDAVGVKNIIINTPDAILVTNKANAQDVEHIYAELKAKGHDVHKLHRPVHRPWGTYTVLEEGDGFKVKRIEVKPGASLSLQMHRHRSEHWVVVNGEATVINGECEILIKTNEATFIPVGHKHRLTNHGTTICAMIEVQYGEYIGEDDIIRLEDAYGRIPGGDGV